MTKKKVDIKPKPKTAAPSKVDEWVEGQEAGESAPVVEQTGSAGGEQGNGSQKMKRLTIDVSEDLHRRIKVGCASRGVRMADEIRGLLEQEFGEA